MIDWSPSICVCPMGELITSNQVAERFSQTTSIWLDEVVDATNQVDMELEDVRKWGRDDLNVRHLPFAVSEYRPECW